jgi:hypothetical protein
MSSSRLGTSDVAFVSCIPDFLDHERGEPPRKHTRASSKSSSNLCADGLTYRDWRVADTARLGTDYPA